MSRADQDFFARFKRLGPDPELDGLLSDRDIEMTEAEETAEESSDRLIIAIDFGTTFSSVAYARFSEETPRDALGLTDVKCIAKYPDDRPPPGVTFTWEPREDVPSELWYNFRSLPEQRQSGDTSLQSLGEELHDEDSTASDSSSESTISSSDDRYDRTEEQDHVKEAGKRSNSLFWGFGVQKQLKKIDIPKDGTGRLARFKLMLDEKSEETNGIRAEIAPVLRNLKRAKLIKQNADVIGDYLQQLFEHTRHELRRLNNYNENLPVEFVLCVPAVWPSKACRTMQAVMTRALQRSELGGLVNNSLDNLFIISEPEAAAACVLAEDNNDIYKNETIVILDAGGGTVDAVTYKVTNSHPLRLSAEVVSPGTRLCGASYVNERYEKLLMKRLKHEKYLIKNGKTIKSIVEGKVIEFENGEKRIINTTDENFEIEPVYIDDLRPNPQKRLYQNRLGISKREMVRVFHDSLKGAAEVLMEQLELAKAKEFSVQKVILIGGFGQSPALQAHLREVVAVERNFLGQELDFLTPRTPSTVVARGAVLRAFNKDQGPSRVTSCSYGFLQTEPYEPLQYPAHKNTRCIIDKADGEKYVDSTINWLIRKGNELPYNQEFSLIVKHTFPLYRKSLICREELYVSDNCHESHYRKTHAMNKAKGAEMAGLIVADMTFLKDEGYIQPQSPSEFSTFSGPRALRYWEVTFELVMIVDGRNLRYEARWPLSSNVDAMAYGQQVHAKGQTCIAAAFKPGTA